MAEPLLAARSIAYRYPGAVEDSLRELTFELSPGELVVLAGRSGSGKTTLLRACCGLVPHYFGGEIGGSLVIAGLDLRDAGPADLGGIVGLVAQDPETQVVSATVRGELELPLEIRGEPPGARARAVEEAALALAIPHLLDRSTAELSGGELQRVALAAALVMRPRLVLLDEPTSQLDPVAGDELIALLRRLNEEWGTAILLAEHRLERCLQAADRVLAMERGRIAFDGRPGDYLRWALEADELLATPGARLFSLAGLGSPPVGVKAARERLAGLVEEPGPQPARPASAKRRAGAPALAARSLWVELEGPGLTRPALRGLDLRVEAGELVALMGRNGAGKTTLLRAAAGLLAPVRGRLEAPGGAALLPQDPASLFAHERVDAELPGPVGRRALERVGLEWAAERDPRDLSGGERQRLALAISMAGREDGSAPALVCLDEPTRGMDAARKRDLAQWLDALAAGGAAVVVATHDVEFAATFARRVVLLGEGVVIADGPADDILSGGWYFATEVARILGGGGAVTPEGGAALLRGALEGASADLEEALP